MMRQRVYVVEFRNRRPGLNKNKVYRRWGPWLFLCVEAHRPIAVHKARMQQVRLDPEVEARVVAFDRRKTKPVTFRDMGKMLRETFK